MIFCFLYSLNSIDYKMDEYQAKKNGASGKKSSHDKKIGKS